MGVYNVTSAGKKSMICHRVLYLIKNIGL